MVKHSWYRRSGKTGAAVMMAAQRGWKYYNCGGDEWTKKQFNGIISPSIIITNLRGANCVVVDNYEFATEEDKLIIESMTDVECFGTLGPIDGDYRIPDSKLWKKIMESVDAGVISMKQALTEFNIVPRNYWKENGNE